MWGYYKQFRKFFGGVKYRGLGKEKKILERRTKIFCKRNVGVSQIFWYLSVRIFLYLKGNITIYFRFFADWEK